ncbi:Error-prone DNA polymerase [compost metagenome]
MNPLAVALSVRSDFSLGESSFQISKIIERAKECGYSHIALTDTMSVSSMPTFSEKAKKAGIEVITGCTLIVVDDPTAKLKDRPNNAFRLKVYVKSEKGLKSLFAALTKSMDADHYYYHARLGFQDVLDLEDVVVTSGDIQSLWHHPRASALHGELAQRFKDDYYVEHVAINTPLFDRLNKQAELASLFTGTQWFISRPAFYATPEDANATDVLKSIATNTPVSSPWVPRPYTRNLCMLTPAEFAAELKAMTDRGAGANGRNLATTVEIAGKCTYRFAKMAPCLPKMADDEFVALVNGCKAGWRERFKEEVWGHKPTDEELATVYKERLAFELGVLRKMNFSGYFLLVQEIVSWAKDNGVRVGPGRGSVGGSLVAYLMGITDVDPIRFGLLFERFINPDRTDLPDADLDFESGKRHMVVDYIINRWGRENVAGIVNFSTLGPASALRDTARMHELDPWEYACSKQMEKEHGVSLSLAESAERVPDIGKFMVERPVIWDHALRLEGANRTLSQHAAGVIVAGEPVTNRAVVRMHKEEDSLPVVQWDKTKVEDFGLIKLDILGLNTLDLIGTALDYILERHGKKINLLSLPLDDKRVLEAFGRGETKGVFQFEGGGMTKLLKDMAMGGTLTFNDLCAATALFRPGPLDAGLCDRYVQVRQGASHAHYDHPLLEECLSETFGVITYQEQVMKLCRVLCGFTPGEADGVRKAIGKKDAEKMAEYAVRFVAGAEASGMEKYKAETLWETILGFAGYAFNKSHSAEYSLISWVTMWLKVYYPAEFFAAAMTVIDKEEKLAGLVLDARSKGLQILPPDLNISSNRIEIEGDDKLYAPFQAIKGISGNVAASILKLREYEDFPKAIFKGGFTVGSAGEILEFDPAIQKAVLGRTQVNSAHREKLSRVGALWNLDKVGHPASHPDRLKDRLELMPGFTVELVKADRTLNAEKLAKLQITRLIDDMRSSNAPSLKGKPIPVPRMGDAPRFMLVFDAPSWEEERAGKMLEGKTADIVKEALKDVQLRAADGYYTALCKVAKEKGAKAITNQQILDGGEFLRQEIEILKPPVIIAMGSNAVRWFSPGLKGSPADLAGKVVYDAKLDASIIFGLNPGMLYHDPSKITLVQSVFDQLYTLLS